MIWYPCLNSARNLLAARSPARLFPYVVPVFSNRLARVRVCLRVGRNGARNLLAARSPARLFPYVVPVFSNRLARVRVCLRVGRNGSEKGISWAWYAGGWKDAAAGHPDPLFQFHHQPFNYFAPYSEGGPFAGRAEPTGSPRQR